MKMKKRKNLLLLLIIVILLVTLGLGYFAFFRQGEKLSTAVDQARDLKTSTQPFFLEVTLPKEGQTFNTNKIEVKGKTNSKAEVFINENQVFPDKNNNFSSTISLEEGENYIQIVAGNDKGDEEVERIVYYEI